MILNYLDGTVQTTNTYTILNNLDTNIIPSVTSNINIGNTDKTIKELFVNDILLDEGDIIKRSRYSVDISTSNITSNIINTEENYIVFNLNQDDLDTNGNGTTTYTLDFTNITIGKVLINDFLGREYNIVLTSPITIDVGTTYSKIITNNNTYNTVGGLSNIESDITGSNIIYTSPIVIIRYYNWGYNTESYFNRNYYSLWNRPYIPTKEIDFYNQEYINDYSIKRVFKNIYYENFYDAKMPTDTIDTLTENLNNELILNNLDANDYFQVISLRYTRDNINSSITDSTTIETGPHFISEDDTQYSTNKYIAFRGKDGAKYRFFITQDISNLIKMTDSITISYIVGSGSVNNGIEDYGNGGDKPINGALRIQILNSNNNIIFNEIIWNSSSGYNANWQLYTISIDNTTRQNGIKLKIVHIYNPSTNTNENWNQTFGIRYIGLNLLNEYKNYINLENIPTSYPTSNNILWSDNYGNLKIDNYQYSQNYNTLENIPFDITTNYIYTNLNKNIGIGTTIPQETLQVNGNTIINSNLTVGSNIYFSGDLYKNGNLYTSYTDSDTSNYLLNNLDTDIVPKDDLTYNLGSPDKKFNELFIGNNSIWFGDTHKISISNNKLKFKKIKTDIIPSGLVTKLDGIINHSEIEQDIKTFTNLTNLSDINLGQWLKYARSKNPSVENINEIFTDVDIDDETQDETIWITNSTSIYNNTSYDKIGIGTTNPTHNLHIEGDTLINGNLLINDLNIMTHIENTSNNLTNIISNTNFLSNTISNDDIEYTNFKHIHQSPVTEYTVLNCDIYNLKIWYKFDGELIGSRIKDYGLLQNHLDIYGSTNGFNTTDYVVYPSSYENNAIDNNYLKMYQNLDLYQYQSTTGLSISFWFKITQTASSTNQYGSFFWFQNTTNNNNLHVRIYNNTNDDFLISIDTYAPSNYIILTPDPPVNIWTHFVLTIDNEGNWSVYIDNINKLITKQVNLSNSIFDDCKILSGTNDTTTIGAIMDDFRIYNKVLTVDEISLLYNRELRIPINLPLINPKPYIEELTGMTDWIKIKHCPVTVGKISGNTFSGSTIDGTFTIGDENDNTAEWAIPFNSDNVKYFCFHSKDSYINSDFKDRWIVIERSEMIKEIQYQSSGGYGYNSLYPHYYKTTYKPNGFVAKTSTYYVGGRRDQIIYNRSGSSLPDPQIATYYVKKDGTPIDPHINNDNLYILVHPYAHYLMYRENGSTELNGIEQSVYVKYTDDIQISINIEPKSVYDTHYTLEYLAEQKTGVKGWRLVRFLPPTSTTWYSVNDNSFGTAPAYGTAYDYTNEWSLDYGGTFDEMFFSTKNMIYWLWTPKTSIEGEYSNVGRLVYKSSNNSSQHNVAWYNRSAYTVDPFISVLNHSVTVNQCLYAENSFSDAHTQLIAGNEGMCVFVRNSTDVITVNNIPEPNYNTLTFGYNESLISYPILDCDSYNLVAHFTFDDSGNLFNNLGKNEIEATGLSGNTTNDGDYTQDGKILGGLYKLSTGDITGYKLTPSNLLSQYFSNKISLTFWIKNEQHVAPHLFRQDDVLSIGIWENALRVIIYDTESTSLYYEVDDQDLSFLQLNEWVHVVITIDASANSSYENSIKVYRNSVNRVLKTPPLSTSYTLGNNFFNSINDFKILGRGNDGGGNGFKGYIDDLRFYDKVLSQEEVTSLYNQYSQTKYEINFSNPTKCDILIVGGGGAGGVDNGGGGGGGGVLYATDIELNGTYTIKVGDGGKTAIPINNPDGYNAKNSGNGYSSEFGIENDMVEVLGGGYGGNAGNTGTISTNGGYGGSGGGGVYNDGIGGIKLQPIYNSLITSANSTYYSGNGGTSVGNIGGGGGGAGGIIPTNHNGADGIQINIDGNNYYWGGGGGGIYWENTAGSGGLGGGGGAGGLTGMEGLGGLGGITNGEDGTGAGSGSTPQGIGGNGGAGTGGGGGGDAYSSPNKGGNGGSGIVIIRYRETYENKNNLISIKNNNNNGITINNKDYIGINNDYPTNTFDINGNININNNENKTALIVTQNTNLPIVDIKKNNDSILFIDNLGNIGINNKLPQKNLHIEVDTLINNNDLIIMNGNIGIGTDNFSQHKLHVIGNTNIDGDLNVSGGLTISGGQTTIDTDVYTTEQLSITNDGSGPALLINQNGTGNILDIKEHNNTILFIKDGGNIGIGTTSPTASLQVGIGTIVSNVDNKSSVCILSEQKPNEELIALSLVNYNNTNPPTSFGTASSIAFHVNKDWEPTAKIMAINTDINIDSTATYKQYTDLVFYTFYHGPLSESMRITCQGDVGIGTATPVSKLDVNGNLNITGDINFTGLINQNSIPIVLSTEITAPANNNNNKVSANIGIHNTDYAFLDLRTNNNLGGWIDFSSIAGEDFSTRIRGHNDPVKLEFYASSTPDMILNSNGDLNVKGNITAYYSDERLKTKIENIDNVLDKIKKISVFKYKPNDIATKYGFSNKQEIGLSAQQISYFYPELVSLAPFDREYDNETKMDKSKSGENYLTLNYERLVPILIQGIKELTKENDFLKNEIIDIKKIINNKN